MERCDHCPLAPGEACGNPTFCRLMASDPRRWAHAVREHAHQRAALIEPPPPPPRPLAAIAAARACPHRRDPQACGCSETATCALGHVEYPTDGTISIGYCAYRCPDRPSNPPAD